MNTLNLVIQLVWGKSKVVGMSIIHSAIRRQLCIQLATNAGIALFVLISGVVSAAQEGGNAPQPKDSNKPDMQLHVGRDHPQKFFDSVELVACCEAINSGVLLTFSNALSPKLDVNTPGVGGVTLLHWALAKNNFEAFELLLKRGATPDAKLTRTLSGLAGHFIEGDSVLVSSLWFGMSRMKFFYAALPYTKKPNQRRKGGQTLLMVHLQRIVDVNEKCIEAILKAGVDINAQDNTGSTALHHGIACGHYILCQNLLRSGADPIIRNAKGMSAIDSAEIEVERIQGHPYSMKEPFRSDLAQLNNLVEAMKQRK